MDSTIISSHLQFNSEAQGPMLQRNGKENMMGHATCRGSDMLCPISTSSALAIDEQPELRAYKLGKQKCSYNQVELVIKDVGTGKLTELKVSEAIETCVGPEIDEQLRESCLKFNVRFVNNNRMYLYIYVVYATPHSTTAADNNSVLMYQWIPVTRSKCRKGCKGPVIRGLQRFGRMPRRNATTLDGEDSWKEPRHLYIAIDEASTHVCPRHETSKFRLLVAAYDDKNQLLGTTVSSSIRVLANNDAPLGAASFKLHCHIKGGWGAACKYNVGSGILENASSPRSYITDDEPKKTMEHDRVILTDDKVTVHLINFCFGSEIDHEVLSQYRIRRTTHADEGDAYPKADKEHTLTDLCNRLFKFCVAKQEHGQTTITLRSLANTLGARRRRVLEVLSVLESVQVIHHQGKERYTWIGSRQLAGALMKIKNTIPRVGEPKDTSRNFLSPTRRAKFKAALARQIDEMRTETNDPLRALSKRFIQSFLVHEGCSVPWEQILQSIVDGRGHDPETVRAKRRRLGEIARIFSALHLIRRAFNQNLKSGLVYEWLGTQGVADHLYNINSVGSVVSIEKAVERRSTRPHQNKFKSPTKQERRGSGGSGGLRGRSRLAGHISGESPSQLEASMSHEISPIPRWRIRAAASVAKRNVSSAESEEVHHHDSSVPQRRDLHRVSSIELHRDSLDQGMLNSTCSSETEDENLPSGDKTDKGSNVETCEGQHLTYEPMGRLEEALPRVMNGSSIKKRKMDHVVSESEELYDSDTLQNCGSISAQEEENKVEPIKPLVTSNDHFSGFSCSTAHHFPYKKRKLQITSFTRLAESENESDQSRDSKSSPSHHEQDELTRDQPGDRTSTFDPLLHLLCFYSPERVFELQSQNPAFFFTYVQESRDLYNKWCAQNAGPTLIRPVANVGSISMVGSDPGIPYSITGQCQPGGFFAASETRSEEGSGVEMRLIKRRSR